MNPKGKKFISLLLVFSLMMLSVNLYAKERRGAKLLITKTDGQQIEGELITVKPNSLLLLNTEGKDVSVGIEDIKVIRIVKKSKFLQSLGIGVLVGAGGGVILGLVQGETISIFGGTFLEGPGPITAGENALIKGAFFGFLGLLVGVAVGLASGEDVKIQIEGKSDKKIKKTLDKLRKKARVRDYK